MTIFTELSEDERQALLYQSACNYLSRREHSRFELNTKLKRKYKEAETEEINKILDYLLSKNFQSDQRFLTDFVEDSFRKGYGPNKIKFKLKSKQTDLSNLEDEFAKYDFFQAAKTLFERKYATKLLLIKELNFEEKQKFRASIQSFFISRGYGRETIQKLLNVLRET